MPQCYDIITFGDMCVDLLLSCGEVEPRFGQVEQLVGDYTLEMGGSTCIFACQAARLGLRAGILGKVGADAFGQLITRRLREYAVDTQYIAIDPALKTGLGVALCQNDDRAILTYPGSLNALAPADVPESFLRLGRHLHHGSYFLLDRLRPGIPALLRRAHELGLTTSLDTNWDPQENWDGGLREALTHTDLFMPNLQELLLISRTGTLQDGIRVIHDLGVRLVAVKLGEAGACVSDGAQLLHCRPMPAAGVAGAVGAGDSFDAGFLSGWLGGASLADCLRLACGCGRAVSGAVGGLAGQPSWDELQRKITDFRVTRGSLT